MANNKVSNWAIVDLSGNLANRLDRTKASIIMQIGNYVIPISQLTLQYGLNAVPTASVVVGLGRSVRTFLDSPIYRAISAIKQMVPVVIYASGNFGDWSTYGKQGAKIQWPTSNQAHILFTGYFSGFSYKRSNGRVSLVANLVNKLYDLSCSSMGSKDVVPGSPQDLMMPALFMDSGGEAALVASSAFMFSMTADMEVDFTNAILKSMYEVAATNQIQLHNRDLWCLNPVANNPIFEQAKNTKAMEVIASSALWDGMQNYAGNANIDNSKANETPYTAFIKKYPLLVQGTSKAAIASKLSSVFFNSLAGSSMWAMLVGSLLPSFGCAVVPINKTAFVTPLIPSTRTAYKNIGSDEYLDLNFSIRSHRPLFGVGVMGQFGFATDVLTSRKNCVGASYVPLDANGNPTSAGMWLFVNAPFWMDDWINFDTTGAPNDLLNKPANTVIGINKPPANAARNLADEADTWNDMMTRYAQLHYITNGLLGREGLLSGKFRLDIAPGSTICIQARSDVMRNGADQLAEDLYGLVARVTVNMDAETASASTTFELTHIRTATENKEDRFSMAQHPFFGNNFFTGAPLVPTLSY